MRYKSEHDEVNGLWYVQDTSGINLPHVGMIGVWEGGAELSEAEANIIAFALNAVAEGQVLMIGTHPLRTIHQGSVPGQNRNTIFYVGDAEVYSSPTKGVAPNG